MSKVPPNLSLNADVPRAGLRPRGGPPVSLFVSRLADAVWHYALDPKRSAALAAGSGFDAVVDCIANDMHVQCRHIQPCDDMAGFSRAAYCISVSLSTFDAFFNSEQGYRGAYYRSPYEGLAANHQLIAAITPKLIAWAGENGGTELGFDVESLSTHSAKAWLAEAGLRFCDRCDGEWTHPQDANAEIFNGRWESAADVRGRKAPRHSKIRIFGAFLNDRLDEFVSGRKRHRAQQIHEAGWS